jgi:hypothetical protein
VAGTGECTVLEEGIVEHIVPAPVEEIGAAEDIEEDTANFVLAVWFLPAEETAKDIVEEGIAVEELQIVEDIVEPEGSIAVEELHPEQLIQQGLALFVGPFLLQIFNSEGYSRFRKTRLELTFKLNCRCSPFWVWPCLNNLHASLNKILRSYKSRMLSQSS